MKEDGQLMLKDPDSSMTYNQGLLKVKIMSKGFRVMDCVDWSVFVQTSVIFFNLIYLSPGIILSGSLLLWWRGLLSRKQAKVLKHVLGIVSQ